MNNYVVSGFYAEAADEETRYPQMVGLRPSSAAFQRVYYRCVMTLMASSVQCNPSARHVFICSAERCP